MLLLALRDVGWIGPGAVRRARLLLMRQHAESTGGKQQHQQQELGTGSGGSADSQSSCDSQPLLAILWLSDHKPGSKDLRSGWGMFALEDLSACKDGLRFMLC